MSDGALKTRASVKDTLTVRLRAGWQRQLLHGMQQLRFEQNSTARKAAKRETAAQVDDLSELKKIAEGAKGHKIGGEDG